jgi:hypothetical protein
MLLVASESQGDFGLVSDCLGVTEIMMPHSISSDSDNFSPGHVQEGLEKATGERPPMMWDEVSIQHHLISLLGTYSQQPRLD